MKSNGTVSLQNVNAAISLDYIKEQFHLDEIHANISASLAYDVEIDDAGAFSAHVEELQIEISNVTMIGFDPAIKFLTISDIKLSGGEIFYPEQQVSINKLSLNQIETNLWLNADGTLNLAHLIPAEDNNQEGEAAAPWAVTLSEFEVVNSMINFEDRQLRSIAIIPLAIEQLSVADINSAPESRSTIEFRGTIDEGSIATSGNFGLDSEPLFKGDLKLTDIPLSRVSPYIEQQIQAALLSGSLTTAISASIDLDQSINATGQLTVGGWNIQDKLDNKQLLAWKELHIDRIQYSNDNLKVSNVTFAEPYARIAINSEGQLNLDALLIEQPTTAPSTADPLAPSPSPSLSIARIGLGDATLDFSDISLPLPFSALITSLNGAISTISTESKEPATINLEGQVNQFGLSRISGTMNTFNPIQHTNIALSFRNLTMVNYSPYTASFAGREIATGKLELGLNYQIEEGQLKGDHNVTLSDLTLGDKVEHADASSLPLGLTISLLKDADGVIDIDLPVSGDMNDPEFEVGGIIFKAFSNLIAKLVTAPFRLLGNLIGIDSDDLGIVEFEPGRTDLTLPEQEKIISLIQGLGKRPELSIVIAGSADPSLDIPALKFSELRTKAIARLDQKYQPGEDMLDDEILDVLEQLYRETHPEAAIATIMESHKAPPADNPDGNPQLDSLAYTVDLRDRLLADIVIDEAALLSLATDRVRSIEQALLNPVQTEQSDTQALAADRLTVAAPVIVQKSTGSGRVTVELTVE